MKDIEVAWIAGLFEGEGCIQRRPGKNCCLTIGMADEDVIHRLQDITGMGHYRTAQIMPSGRPFYVWQISKADDAVSLLCQIMPYLGKRRTARALEELARMEFAPPDPKRSPFCKRGHPFDGQNLYHNGRQRICRTCERDRTREVRARKHAAVSALGG